MATWMYDTQDQACLWCVSVTNGVMALSINQKLACSSKSHVILLKIELDPNNTL